VSLNPIWFYFDHERKRLSSPRSASPTHQARQSFGETPPPKLRPCSPGPALRRTKKDWQRESRVLIFFVEVAPRSDFGRRTRSAVSGRSFPQLPDFLPETPGFQFGTASGPIPALGEISGRTFWCPDSGARSPRHPTIAPKPLVRKGEIGNAPRPVPNVCAWPGAPDPLIDRGFYASFRFRSGLSIQRAKHRCSFIDGLRVRRPLRPGHKVFLLPAARAAIRKPCLPALRRRNPPA